MFGSKIEISGVMIGETADLSEETKRQEQDLREGNGDFFSRGEKARAFEEDT